MDASPAAAAAKTPLPAPSPPLAGRKQRASSFALHGVSDDRAIVIRGFIEGTTVTVYGPLLTALSAACGPILSHALAADQTAVFLLFESPVAAEKAVALGCLASLISHDPPQVGLHAERAKADPRAVLPSSSIIVLKNLAYDLSLDTLKLYLASLPVKPASVDLHLGSVAHAGSSFSGIAFAKYATSEDARVIMQHVHGSLLNGRTIKAEYKRVRVGTAPSPYLGGVAGSGVSAAAAGFSLGAAAQPASSQAPAPMSPFLAAAAMRMGMGFGSPLHDPLHSPAAAAAVALAGLTHTEHIPFLSLSASAMAAAPMRGPIVPMAPVSSPQLGATAVTPAASMPPLPAVAESPRPGTPGSPGQLSTVFSSLVAARAATLQPQAPAAPADAPVASPVRVASPAPTGAAAPKDRAASFNARLSAGAREFSPGGAVAAATALPAMSGTPVFDSMNSPLAAALFAALPPEFMLASMLSASGEEAEGEAEAAAADAASASGAVVAAKGKSKSKRRSKGGAAGAASAATASAATAATAAGASGHPPQQHPGGRAGPAYSLKPADGLTWRQREAAKATPSSASSASASVGVASPGLSAAPEPGDAPVALSLGPLQGSHPRPSPSPRSASESGSPAPVPVAAAAEGAAAAQRPRSRTGSAAGAALLAALKDSGASMSGAAVRYARGPDSSTDMASGAVGAIAGFAPRVPKAGRRGSAPGVAAASL